MTLVDEKMIGICVARMQDDTRQKHVRAICDSAEKQGYKTVIFNVFEQLFYMNSFDQGEISIFDKISMHRLSALILFSESFLNPQLVQTLVDRAKESNLPVICVDRRVEGCYNVLFTYEESFEELVRHIVEYHGCKRINFMAGTENNDFSDARLHIFQKVLKENGIPFEKERLAYGGFWEIPARRSSEEWVKLWKEGKQEMPDAIICANDIMALTVCNVLRNNGIRVPEDVLLTGFDGLELNQYFSPRLTTACDDIELIGKEIVNMVEKCCKDTQGKPYDIRIPFRTKFTESCGCQKKAECNPNEQIMIWYGKAAEMRSHTAETFLMMNELTDGYSAVDMAKKLEKFHERLQTRQMTLFIEPFFYKNTDLPDDGFGEDSCMLLAEIQNGEYYTRFEEVTTEQSVEQIQKLLYSEDRILFVPIHWQEEVYGYMIVSYDDAAKDFSNFYEFILAFGQVMGTIRQQSQLHRMYVTDMLTKLYNRSGFYNQMQKKLQKKQEEELVIFLASVDMDGLKYINDTYGHAEGDYAIKKVAEFLKKSVAERDGICARFGGDEYVVAVVTDKQKADTAFYDRYDKILQEEADAFNQTGRKPFRIGMSVGALYCDFKDMKDVDQLMKRTDDIMYQVKCQHHDSRLSRLTQNRVGNRRSREEERV